MGKVNWLKIMIFILQIIASGMSKSSAVHLTSVKFGVSPSDIWKHGGF